MRDATQVICSDPEIVAFTGQDLEQPRRNLNLDVEVRVKGTRWGATFFTLANVEALFAKNAATGECRGGSYLWAAEMILVRELSAEIIRETVGDLFENGEFEAAFTELEQSGSD